MGGRCDRPAARENSTLLVVDLQERLMPVIAGGSEVLRMAERLVRAAALLQVPVLATEQYPKGLGRTVAPLASLLPAETVYEKTTFSSCGAPGLVERLARLGRRQVVVIGVESHVCVQQTVLALLAAGYEVFVAADAVSSRRATDRQVALERLRQAGAVVTTVESVIFEWLKQAGTAEFKEVSKIVKDL